MRPFRFAHVGIAAMLGAACVTVAGLVSEIRAAPGDASAYVPIVPCRLFDTRADQTVGTRSTPINPNEVATFAVWGQNGNCNIPNTATGIASNATAVNPTASSYLTLYPADAARPLASNLNWTPTSPPTPNQVTVGLSATGAVSVYNLNGTIDVVVDIVGYYLATAGGPQGPDGPQGIQGPQGPPGPLNRITDQQIARLQWWQDPGRAATFAAVDPLEMAFDGTNIWATKNSAGNSVSKFDRNTGARTDYLAGNNSYGIAFDGRYVWVANGVSDTVSRIDPSLPGPGTPVNFAAGDGPSGIAFDGRYVWVTNPNNDTITRIDPTSPPPGTPVTYLSGTIAVDDGPSGIAFDGTNLWVTNFDSNTVSKINPNGPAPGAPVNYTTGVGPWAVAFDGTNVWVANLTASTVSKIDPNAVAPGAPISYSVPGGGPRGLAYDGSSLWITSVGGDTVVKLNPQAAPPGDPVSYTVGDAPRGVVFDGQHIWVANSVGGTISRLIP